MNLSSSNSTGYIYPKDTYDIEVRYANGNKAEFDNAECEIHEAHLLVSTSKQNAVETYVIPFSAITRYIRMPHRHVCTDPELKDHCSGCTDPNAEGTHQGCTKEHGHVGCKLA